MDLTNLLNQKVIVRTSNSDVHFGTLVEHEVTVAGIGVRLTNARRICNMINKLVLTLTYYNAPLMLREQLKYWQEYPEELGSEIKVILIDDGSYLLSAEKILRENPTKITVELYRITKDIPQNTFGARNLAFHIASVEGAKWVLCTDIDHALPSRGLDGFLELKPTLSPAFYYHPNRYEKQLKGITPLSTHLDSYLITPELYWKAGGYDEDLTGYYYNGPALHFRIALSKISKGIEIEKLYTIFYPSSIISDASPLEGQERKVFKSSYSDKKKPSVLNFEWERVL